jgi:hypothetical protein
VANRTRHRTILRARVQVELVSYFLTGPKAPEIVHVLKKTQTACLEVALKKIFSSPGTNHFENFVV